MRAHRAAKKIIKRRSRTLTLDEFGHLLTAVPERHVLLVLTAVETRTRWGELIALRPRHADFLRHGDDRGDDRGAVEAKLPSGERMIVKPYPKDNEPRTFGVRPDRLDDVAEHIRRARHLPRRAAVQHRRRYADLAQHVPYPRVATSTPCRASPDPAVSAPAKQGSSVLAQGGSGSRSRSPNRSATTESVKAFDDVRSAMHRSQSDQSTAPTQRRV